METTKIDLNKESLSVQIIYPSFMGEVNTFGIGAPCTFVRFYGCNLRCYSHKGMECDTPEALTFKPSNMSIRNVIRKVEELGNKIICLTGGEPLAQEPNALYSLLSTLCEEGYSVVIETNGTKDISPIKSWQQQFPWMRDVSFVIDYKSPSTGVSDFFFKMSNVPLMGENDYLKFVVADEVDLAEFIKVRQKFVSDYGLTNVNFAVGLFWGASKISYKFLLSKLQALPKYGGKGVYVNMQTHKMVCMYDEFKGSEQFLNTFIPKDL